MNRQTIIHNEYVTLWYHPETKIVHHQMHQFVIEARFQEFLQAGTRLLKEHGACKWLSDDRKNPVLAPTLRDWSLKNWIPPTVAAGWKHWAIVQPEELLGQWSMDRAVADIARLGVNAEYFSDPETAMQWLLAQPNPKSPFQN